MIVADVGRIGQRMLVGSEDFSVASLDYNRELGIMIGDPALIKTVSDVLAADYAGDNRYHQPASAGAWCKATATVYNAAADENNVYVRSNQPDTEATASADGYTHSYPTDGSGYALIYLNGPPPGAFPSWLTLVHLPSSISRLRRSAPRRDWRRTDMPNNLRKSVSAQIRC